MKNIDREKIYEESGENNHQRTTRKRVRSKDAEEKQMTKHEKKEDYVLQTKNVPGTPCFHLFYAYFAPLTQFLMCHLFRLCMGKGGGREEGKGDGKGRHYISPSQTALRDKVPTNIVLEKFLREQQS